MRTYTTYSALFNGWVDGVVPDCILQEVAHAIFMTSKYFRDKPVPSVAEFNYQQFSKVVTYGFLCEPDGNPDISLDSRIGGSVSICYTEEDLLKIPVVPADLNITSPEEFFVDVFTYAAENPETNFVLAMTVTNDAGGDLFFIPDLLWKYIPRFEKLISGV